jgi:hypothetical protein
VALATLLWVGIVLAAMQVGAPSRAPAGHRELSARAGARASAARS